jgi:hypothetical protein
VNGAIPFRAAYPVPPDQCGCCEALANSRSGQKRHARGQLSRTADLTWRIAASRPIPTAETGAFGTAQNGSRGMKDSPLTPICCGFPRTLREASWAEMWMFQRGLNLNECYGCASVSPVEGCALHSRPNPHRAFDERTWRPDTVSPLPLVPLGRVPCDGLGPKHPGLVHVVPFPAEWSRVLLRAAEPAP